METQASLEKVLDVSRAFDLPALQPDQGSRSQLLPLINTIGDCTGCEWLAGDWLVAPTQTCEVQGNRMGWKGRQATAFLDLPTGTSSGSEV